ncbi:hypothetical protein EON63_13510 [archaeon]|nr:MAG: hypothetical protein EON63_13510 [archaeon]
MSDEQKRALADYVILTDYEGYVEGRAQLARVIEDILKKEMDRFEKWKRRQGRMGTGVDVGVGGDEILGVGVGRSDGVVVEEDHPPRIPQRPWDAVIFDLDDTLAPSVGPLKEAYQHLTRYMLQHMPNTYRVVQGQVHVLMKR